MWNFKKKHYDSNNGLQTNGAIHRVCDMLPHRAHRLWGVRHPLGYCQRDSKRSVPSGDRHNRGYPFHNRLLRLHPLVIHPLILTDMAKRNNKTAAQQCRYYGQLYRSIRRESCIVGRIRLHNTRAPNFIIFTSSAFDNTFA